MDELLHVDGQLIATGKLTRRARNSNRLGLDLGPGDSEGVLVIDEVQILGRALNVSENTN